MTPRGQLTLTNMRERIITDCLRSWSGPALNGKSAGPPIGMAPPPPNPRSSQAHVRGGGGEAGFGGREAAGQLPDPRLCPVVLGTVSARARQAPETLRTSKPPPHPPTNETEWLSSIWSGSRQGDTRHEQGTRRSEPPTSSQAGGQGGGPGPEPGPPWDRGPGALFCLHQPDEAALGALGPRVLVRNRGENSVRFRGGYESR